MVRIKIKSLLNESSHYVAEGPDKYVEPKLNLNE